MNTPAKLTDNDALELAEQYRQASSALRKYRLGNSNKLSQPRQDELKQLEASLRDAARDMTTTAAIIVINESQTNLAELRAIHQEAIEVLDTINGIKKVIDIVTALLGLASAISTGKPKEVWGNVQALRGLLA
ncbi:MAG: hypothetical protein ABW202_14315 [Duganella sp.]